MIRQLDASEKKEREAAKIKENFLANMSHEIRTPMNAILGFTTLLQKKQLEPEAALYVHTIRQSGENLLAIINDILDLSRIEAGMMRIEPAPFSVRSLAHSIETMFLEKTKEKGLLLSTSVADDVPDILEGDAVRLTQILVNLIGNAVKFTQQGSINIAIQSTSAGPQQVNLLISVNDTGIGIEKDQLPRIFDRFRQAEDSITRRYGGTGLGLSIVKDLVDLQKGSITVLSEPGLGTRFQVSLSYKIPVETTITPLQHRTGHCRQRKGSHCNAATKSIRCDPDGHTDARDGWLFCFADHQERNAAEHADHCHDSPCIGRRERKMPGIGNG
ncbi:MAG: hypothetical protein EOP49_54290 [Sphingobacteriales bacterium]|nr:MAG: hypothetical protein EOP49_54290 [Sphingobacteriales bacterium]